jgi:hypothetical protein
MPNMNKRDKRLLESWKRDGFKVLSSEHYSKSLREIVKARGKDSVAVLEKVCAGGLRIRRTHADFEESPRDRHLWTFDELQILVDNLKCAITQGAKLKCELDNLWRQRTPNPAVGNGAESYWCVIETAGGGMASDKMLARLSARDKSKEARVELESAVAATKAWREIIQLIDAHAQLISAFRTYRNGSWYYNLDAASETIKPVGSGKRKLIAELALLLNDSVNLEPAPVGGPSETRGLTLDEQKLAEDMRQRGKGTEKGSIRVIASEIGLEQRKYSDRTWKKKEPALIQDVKRHFRRKGLIRSN